MTQALPPVLPALVSLGARANPPLVEKHVGPARPWLVTIVDLMTILLTFFVLLFSLSDVDMARFTPIARSYGEAFSGRLPDDTAPRLPEVEAVPGDNLSYLEAVLRAAFAKHAGLADVQFRATPQYLILSWPQDDLFASGSSGFTEPSRRRVFDLGGVLNNLHNRVAVVGTVVADGQDGQVDSWRLAIDRANAVAGAFADAGYAKELTVLGRRASMLEAHALTQDGRVGQVQIFIMPERPGS